MNRGPDCAAEGFSPIPFKKGVPVLDPGPSTARFSGVRSV